LKICFISGPSRPNQCGISDYVRLLTDELKLNGHKINLASVESKNDLSNILKDQLLYDLYSLQYAPYSFSSKGIIGKPLFDLGKTLHDRKVHINFHEIWIGDYPNAPLKEKLIGWLQKRAIRKFLKIIRPALVTCSNSAALDRLKSARIKAEYLYLFGNIPYSKLEVNCNENLIKVAIFGTLYEKFPYDLLLKRLKEISDIQKRKLQLRVIGRQRESRGLSLLQKLANDFKFIIYECGELRTDSISHELQICDLGVCTTPYDILGKSGATAAMLEHGLPIIAFDDGDTSREKLFVIQEFDEQIFLLNENTCIENLISLMVSERKPFFNGVKRTAKDMIDLIS
jgi:hypothetical protein